MKDEKPFAPRSWMLLTYQVPRHPSAARVYVWRKLKRLGAELLHDSVWLLPASDRTAEEFRWLAGEIKELHGEALVWVCRSATEEQEEKFVNIFRANADRHYGEILSDIKKGNCDLAAMSRRYQDVLAMDYFGSRVGAKVRQAILKKQRR